MDKFFAIYRISTTLLSTSYSKRTGDGSLFLFKEINFHHLDVQSIAKYLKIKGNIEGEISLSILCKIYNLKRLKNHDALELTGSSLAMQHYFLR